MEGNPGKGLDHKDVDISETRRSQQLLAWLPKISRTFRVDPQRASCQIQGPREPEVFNGRRNPKMHVALRICEPFCEGCDQGFGKAKVPTSVGVEFRWSIVCHAVSSAGFCSKVRFFPTRGWFPWCSPLYEVPDGTSPATDPHSAFIDEFMRDTADAHTVRYQSNFIMMIYMNIYIYINLI